MSEILCKWLNQELQLSKAVEPKSFAKDFSNGYLFGEVLHKYQLQNDFSMFMKKDTSVSKLNNFTRLEPTLQLLGISFNINTAQELMQEKQGVATRLLYQLYTSLEKKKRSEISGTMMEVMQPAANAALHKKHYEIYSDRLHQVVKRDAELKLQKISQHYEEKFQQLRDRSAIPYPIQQERQLKVQDRIRIKNIELQMSRQKYSGIMPLKQAGVVQVPKPPSHTLQLNLKKRLQKQHRRQQQAQNVQTDIAQFEINKKKLVSSGFASSSSVQPLPGSSQSFEVSGGGTKLILQSNSEYIQEIREKLEENAIAREQREKRRDRFLVEQLKAHEAQEEARREEQLVKRLTRQTQQEKCLAVQLLQIRMQKEVIRENRLFRELQYQQRRDRDIQESLEKEATLALQAKLGHAKEIRKELEFLSRIAAERAQFKYQKHFKICKDILRHIVDLATKVGEYRLLSGNLIPQKLMREWKELLLNGLPLYELTKGPKPAIDFSAPLDPVEHEKQELLNNQDYDEYANMVGEWTWQEDEGAYKLPLTNNNILGHVVQRLRNIIHPPSIEPSTPLFPPFTLKGCVLGKFCTGKTTCLTRVAEAHGLVVLSPDKLVKEVLNAYWDREEVPEPEAEKANDQLITSSSTPPPPPPPEPDLDIPVESVDRKITLSTRAMQGQAVEAVLKQGKTVPNDLLLEIIVEAIRQVPAQSGWILDSFPEDITQAQLLEKALGGSVDVGNEVESSRTNLAVDPNPPKPPPPPAPVLDLVLLLDISDDSVVRRAYSQPETDSAVDMTSQTTAKSLYLAQIPPRINAFRDTWPKLEQWFGERQNILVHIDASVDEEELYKRVDSVLQQILVKRQEACAPPPVEDELDSEKAPVSSSSATPPLVDLPLSLTDEASDQTLSNSSLNEAEAKSLPAKSNTQSPKVPPSKASVNPVTNEDVQGVPESSPGSACPSPGSSNWVYVDEPLPQEIPEYLCSLWEAMCVSYVNNTKKVMQQLRSQRAVVNHLFHIREGFKHYLGRPDLKQELVSQWQKDFNSKPDDMREDEDTKAELHLRLDELLERLWDISDKCKEQNEQERDALMYDGWLEENIALLVNHHSTLIQMELNRFQKTVCFLKVYYSSMYKPILPEPPLNIITIHLVNIQESKDQDERRTDSSQGLIKTTDQDQMDAVKQPQQPQKLFSDYEEALKVIGELVSTGAHHGETNEEETKDKNHEVRHKIQQECAAAISHEVNAAKVRIALIKAHGLIMVKSLQSRAEQTLSDMQKWLEAHYLAEMKSIEHLSEVVCYHIEDGSKLLYELVLECTDFYLNGDCHMVAPLVPPPRPPPLERPTQSTLTIAQLESLYHQLWNIAPSGIMSGSEFFRFLRDIVSVNTGIDSLPKSWRNKTETQLKEIVSLLIDHYQHIDWRRFLLSAALPWPFPSITELLVVLQRFKTADTNSTGHINEQQYLQEELWFSSEGVQPPPEDPSEPLPFDRLANLRKFFFHLFADHFFSPPRLDYVSMLQYFAADPNPREGFIRSLSVVLGEHLKLSTAGQLVQSMPSLEEATELSTSEPEVEPKKEEEEEEEEEETLCASDGSFVDPEVSIPALFAVICHKATKRTPLPPGSLSLQHLVHIFKELGFNPEDHVPFSIISQHPFIQCLMESSTHYQLVNICPSE